MILNFPLSDAQPLDSLFQPKPGPPTPKSGSEAEAGGESGVLACGSLAPSAKSSTCAQAPQPGRGTGLFQEGAEISSGFYRTSLRARHRGRTAKHAKAGNRQAVEAILQPCVARIKGGDGAAHLGLAADGVSLQEGLLQAAQKGRRFGAVEIDLQVDAVLGHGVAQAASNANLLKLALDEFAELGPHFGLGPLFLQVGDFVHTDKHDADALELLLAENRFAGGLGVANAGERVVGRCFGESGVDSVVFDVADGDAEGGFGIAAGEFAVFGAEQAGLVATGEPGAETVIAALFEALVEAVDEAAEQALHGVAEIVAVVAKLADAPVILALG